MSLENTPASVVKNHCASHALRAYSDAVVIDSQNVLNRPIADVRPNARMCG